MSRSQEVILTNMCLIEDAEGRIVMQYRDPKRYSWSGYALPGGHVEGKESFHDSVVREIYEETGLIIKNPKLVGIKNWHTSQGIRYIVFLYKAESFSGNLRSSKEGKVEWIERRELADLELAYDMINLLRVFDEDSLSEYFYHDKVDGEWQKEFY